MPPSVCAMATRDPRKVTFVSPVGEIGGGEKVLLKLAEHLASRGTQVSFVCLRPGPLEKEAAVFGTVYAFRFHRYREMRAVWAARRWLAAIVLRERPDVIHVNHSGWIYVAGMAELKVLHLHDYPHRFDILDLAHRWFPPEHVIFTSDYVKSGFKHMRKACSAVIPPWCVDVAALSRSSTTTNVREKYQLGEGPVFLTVARLQAHKGHLFLLKAIASLKHLSSGVRFLIIGKAADDEQATYEAELKTFASEHGLREQVKFLGFVNDEDLIGLYHEATCLIHPALTEGYGLVLIEAMACGTPVLAADAAGPTMILEGASAGELVKRGDEKELAAAIEGILTTPGWRSKYEAGARNRAQQLSSAAMCARTLDFYRQALTDARDLPAS